MPVCQATSLPPVITEREIIACGLDPFRFIDGYVCVYDAISGEWIPFKLWPAQAEALDSIHANYLTVILKARQLGFTWLMLAYALWHMLFHPVATVLLFSRRDDEAVDMLNFRMGGMYDRLPPELKARAEIVDNDHEWELSNGSRAMAFPTTAGDSYTASLVLVDEADLVPNLSRLLAAVKPTIDAGGRLILLSRADKSTPESEFKRTYREAKKGSIPWKSIFVPWHAHPERNQAWYARQKADILHRTGTLDGLHEQYPDSDVEALSPRTLDKRVAPDWLRQCYREIAPSLPEGCPSIPGLEVYVPPQPGRNYLIGADPAEGNPTSDDSALTVLDRDSGEEMAALAGKFQPAVLAAHADAVGRWYNKADLMVERNNHGHAVLLWLRDNSKLRRLKGLDGNEGWLSSTRGKAVMYDATADAFRESETILHSFATFTQLASIEGTSLRAPDGQHDDRADSFALGVAAIVHTRKPKINIW